MDLRSLPQEIYGNLKMTSEKALEGKTLKCSNCKNNMLYFGTFDQLDQHIFTCGHCKTVFPINKSYINSSGKEQTKKESAYMTKKEFIEKTREKGYTVKEFEWCIEVYSDENTKIAHVNLLNEKGLWTGSDDLPFVELCTRFANTPLEERKEKTVPAPKGVQLKEQRRIYHFPNNEKIEIQDVVELKVSDSGNHRLKTADGRLHIVTAGWLHIEITGPEDWTI